MDRSSRYKSYTTDEVVRTRDDDEYAFCGINYLRTDHPWFYRHNYTTTELAREDRLIIFWFSMVAFSLFA